MDTKEYDLITMGRSCIDLYSNDVGAPFEEITSFAAYVGGSPTNIAVGSIRLGLKTALLTAIGKDPVGDFIMRFLNDEGVDTQYIPTKLGHRSSAVILGIEPPDQFPLVFYRDNAADIYLTMDDVLATPVERTKVFEISGTGLSKDPSRSSTFFACELAKSAGSTIVMDLDFRADQWFDVRAFGVYTRVILPMVDVAIGTEEEINAATLVDSSKVDVGYSQISAPTIEGDIELAVSEILQRGPKVVVVKRGSKGATLFFKDGKQVDVPGFPVEVYNVLGAGDAFTSGFIYGIVHNWDWYKATRMGNACGAIVVTRHGCANFMGYEDEVLEFIESHGGF